MNTSLRLLIALTLVACGGSKQNTPPVTPTAPAPTAPAPTSAAVAPTPGPGASVPPGQVFTSQTAKWADVAASAETCRSGFRSGAGSNDCMLLVAVYDYVEGRKEGATALMAAVCPKVSGNTQRKAIVFEVIIDGARLYWIKQGKPQPAGPLANEPLATAITAIGIDPLLTSCGATM